MITKRFLHPNDFDSGIINYIYKTWKLINKQRYNIDYAITENLIEDCLNNPFITKTVWVMTDKDDHIIAFSFSKQNEVIFQHVKTIYSEFGEFKKWQK